MTLVVPEPAVSHAVVEATAAPIPTPVAPAVTEASELAHARAQARALGGVRLPALQASTSAAEGRMPGFFVPIDDPLGGPALASFHSALRTLAEGHDPDGKVRVAMYGASGTAADVTVGYLRTYLQARFGDGGPGFVPLVPLSNGYRHSEVVVKASKGWKKETASRGRQDGLYGLLGASSTATAARRKSQVTPKDGSTSSQGIARAEVFFLRQPGGGSFSLVIDDGPPQVVSTAGEAYEPGYYAVELEPGPHGFRVETLDRAEVRVFGIVLERRNPGVVVDVLGINGARGASHLEWNEALWADNLRRRAPDLYTLSYGTNESVDASLSLPRYTERVREQLRRFRRALPEASCVLLGPVDFPMIEAGHIRPRPVLREIVEAQRQVAAEEGCGFWDGMAFMGGELSMPAWVNADPPLACKDHLHYTHRGGARKGMALADALMLGFDAPGNSLGGESQALLPVPR
jgi:lysophospholipase L1-like esterase